MSTTEAGRLPAAGKPDSSNRDGVPLQAVPLQVVMESARRLDELSGARIVGNIAEAVHAAQRSGQPLAALTPSAIVVQADGGVAFAAAPASPRYLAPERLRGGSGDRRSDVFALGMMLWEVLAHERLFAGDDDEAVRRAVLEAAVRPPSELNANVPAELDAICKRALAREPAERYQSAKAMAADIEAVLGDAGYPESNEPIATFVAAMAAPPPRPAAIGAPRVDRPQATMPLPAVQPPAATRPPTAPPAAQPSAARPATQPPRAGTQPPIVQRPGTQPPVIQPPAEPPSAAAAPLATARTAPLPSLVSSSPRDTMPPPFVPRQGASTAILGSVSPAAPTAPPASGEAAVRPAKSARTEILGSLSTPAEKPPLGAAALLGSNAIAGATPAGSPATGAEPAPDPVPPAAVDAVAPSSPFAAVPVPLGSFAPDLDLAPSFAPPAMPEPLPSTGASPPGASPPGADGVGSPVPAGSPKPSIADAEAVATPQLGMPPGMTVAPASAPVPLRTTDSSLEDDDDDDDDGDFGRERHVDPATVVALRNPERNTGGRDVLAGWGWSTDSVQAITDEDDFPDTARASRKRLVIAIGGALGVVVVIAAAAFVFGGSKQPDPDAQVAAKPVTAPPVAPSGAAAADHAAPDPTATPPAGEPASTEPAAGGTPPSNPAAEPPTPADQPAAPAAPAAAPSSTAPAPAVPAADPPPPPPAKATAAPLPPPVKVAAAPAKPSPPPVKATAAPAKPSPPPVRVAAAPAKPPRVAAALPEPTKKPAAKKPTPRTDKALKRPMPPERIARATPKAQPIDPYGAVPDNPRTDPAAAYRTGLQQYARGDTAGALSTFRASLSSNPSFAPTWRGLGLVYEKLGNPAQARSSFQRYLKLAPDAPDADQVRARLEHLGSGS